jgi:hypothetical protein
LNVSITQLFPSDADVCLLLLGIFVCFSSQSIMPSLSFWFHFRDYCSAQTDSNNWIFLCICWLCLDWVKLFRDSGRDGHGAEWRTSCSEREAGTTKKSRTGTVIFFWTTPLPPSLSLSLFRHQISHLPSLI